MNNKTDELAKASLVNSNNKAKQTTSVTYKPDNVFFSYDDLKIFGVLHNHVFVIGYYWKEEIRVECILKFTKSLFNDTLALWLKDKEVYCERYQEFCGEMGSIISSNFETTDQEVEYFESTLSIFFVNSIEDNCDMEHG